MRQAQLALQLRNRALVEIGQAGIETLDGAEFSARLGGFALFGKQLRLYVMRFGAGRMVRQHLGNHLLCLIQMPAFGRGIDLARGWIAIGQGRHCTQAQSSSKN